MYLKMKEGNAELLAPAAKTVSSRMEVFYNPVMKLNRDLSVALLKAVGKKRMRIADPLAGTGIRGIRFIRELPKSQIEYVLINDKNPKAYSLINRNLRLNKVKPGKAVVTRKDASMSLLEHGPFDYIDIDPFGFPGPFIDAAVKALARNGILAVTATDTAALCGTYPKVCRRNYWAEPMHGPMMYETGLRILIRRVQLGAAGYEKALIPLFSYSRDHYMRVFLRCESGAKKADDVVSMHKAVDGSEFMMGKKVAGPLWTGPLWDAKLVREMLKQSPDKDAEKLLGIINAETSVNALGYFDLHYLASRHKTANPRIDELIRRINKKGYKAARTHFLQTGVRTDMPAGKFIKMLGN